MNKHFFFGSRFGTRLLKKILLILITAFVTVWLVRAYNSRSIPDTSPWHKGALQSEFRSHDYPDGIDFSDYQALEARLAGELQQFVDTAISPQQANEAVRYTRGSPLNPLEFTKNWNWSFVLEHEESRGAVVLVHGASDSPYSLLALARRLHEDGLTAIAIRLPGHGTLPGELARVNATDWMPILHSAMHKARDIIGRDKPIYIAGYSMGAALALKFTLDGLTDKNQELPAGVILISPAIEINPLAAFASVDLQFSRIPGFKKFAWTAINPEYDPYKYNSFPKQAGHQTYLLAASNQKRIKKLSTTEAWKNLPPIITFMSAVDDTVSVSAVVHSLYQNIQSKGSSLVIFGVNRTNETLGFLKEDYLGYIKAVQFDTKRGYDLTVVANRDARNLAVSATTYCAENLCQRDSAIEAVWPNDVFSLSHVALPFRPDDPIYGAEPGPESPVSFTLGSLQPRGERGILVVSTESLMRLRYNPFIDYLLDRTSEFCD